MTDILNLLVAIVCSYLLGSIPTAYWFGKIFKKIDIRQYGSGNVGATNAFRVLGKGPGTLVLLIDILKGVLATTVVGNLCQVQGVLGRVVLSIAVISGHNWTIFLNFKGGKGIATSLGVLIGLTIQFVKLRPVLLISVASWLIVFVISGYVSLSSIVAAVVLPLAMVFTAQPFAIVALGIICCFFVVLRHRPNIKRISAGTESRVKIFGRKGQR